MKITKRQLRKLIHESLNEITKSKSNDNSKINKKQRAKTNAEHKEQAKLNTRVKKMKQLDLGSWLN